jgi:hypothetical protein
VSDVAFSLCSFLVILLFFFFFFTPDFSFCLLATQLCSMSALYCVCGKCFCHGRFFGIFYNHPTYVSRKMLFVVVLSVCIAFCSAQVSTQCESDLSLVLNNTVQVGAAIYNATTVCASGNHAACQHDINEITVQIHNLTLAITQLTKDCFGAGTRLVQQKIRILYLCLLFFIFLLFILC